MIDRNIVICPHCDFKASWDFKSSGKIYGFKYCPECGKKLNNIFSEFSNYDIITDDYKICKDSDIDVEYQ
jgi:hypothetical protein